MPVPITHDRLVFSELTTTFLLGGIMGGVIRFVFAIIWIALALGATGQLLDATIFIKFKAEETLKSKGISAREWNKALIEEAHISKPK